MDKSLKWTSRGTSQCPQCHNSYSNAWKPKNCKHCSYEIGGEHVPSAKRLKADSPHSVLIVDSETIKIFSVHLNHREKRVFVVKRITSGDTTFMCHHKKCVESRAVHQASSQQFTCDHIKATETYDPPPSAKNFFVDDITSYKCDASTREQLTKMLVPPEDFRHLVSISDSCCAIYTSSSPSNPVGYCHCTRGDDGVWLCSSSSCNKKGGRSKQTKTRTMCSHLHVLYCILKPDAPLSNSLPTVDVSHDDSSMSTSRKSTIKLGLTRTVPYPVPPHILQAFRKQLDLPSSISPSLINCELCGSSLVPGKHPGRADSDASYILTPWAIKTVNVSVKFCTHRDCKAMHQAWPIDQGLFNICDKLFVALEILVHWRELFKRGVPLTVAIESHLAAWTKSGEITFTDGEQKYITSLLYNGFYAFELMSERCLDSVICGVCGIVGQVYYGDGNEKNCCSIEKVDYNFRVEEGQEQLPSLEDFMLDLRKIFTEKNMFSRSLQDDTIKAVHVPPIIAPSMRGETVVNTEMEKKSIYLNGGFFDKDKIIGDPMMLHQLIRSKNLDMSSLEQMTRQDLDTICRECKIDNASTLTKALAVQQLQTLYSSLLTGSSPCHGFTQVRGHSGGFYHMVCRHG